MAEPQDPILKLDTLVERRTVMIDGASYGLVNSGELSILDFHRIGYQGRNVENLMAQQEDLNDEQVEAVRRLLDSMCKVLLLAPVEIHARLSDNQRLQIVQAFTGLLRAEAAPPAEELAAAAPQTGESTSPAS